MMITASACACVGGSEAAPAPAPGCRRQPQAQAQFICIYVDLDIDPDRCVVRHNLRSAVWLAMRDSAPLCSRLCSNPCSTVCTTSMYQPLYQSPARSADMAVMRHRICAPMPFEYAGCMNTQAIVCAPWCMNTHRRITRFWAILGTPINGRRWQAHRADAGSTGGNGLRSILSVARAVPIRSITGHEKTRQRGS